MFVIKVLRMNCVIEGMCEDDYKNVIPYGMEYIKGNFLEKRFETKSSTVFQLSEKVTYFYKESIIFPFVNIVESKKGIEINNKEWLDIICHAEQTGYAHL